MKLGNQIQNFFKLVAIRPKVEVEFIHQYQQVRTYLSGLSLDLSKLDRVNEVSLPKAEGSHIHKLASYISRQIKQGVSEFTLSSVDGTQKGVSFFIPTRDVETVDIPRSYTKTGLSTNKIGGNTFEKIGGLGRGASAKEYMICRSCGDGSPFKVGDVLEMKEYEQFGERGVDYLAVRRHKSTSVRSPISPAKLTSVTLSALPTLPVLTTKNFASVLDALRTDPWMEGFKANSSEITLTGEARDASILAYSHTNMRVEGVSFKDTGKPYCTAQYDVEVIDFSREPNTQIVFSSGKAWEKTMPAAKEAFQKISTISAVGTPTELGEVKFPNYMNFQTSLTGEITYGLAKSGTPERKIQDDLGITGVTLKSSGDVLAHVELMLTSGKTIQLYHFFGWPDKKAFPVESLTDQDNVLLAQRYSAYETAHLNTSKELDGAYLTHCSAGIGRTGADAVMSDLLRQMEEKKTKDDVLAVLSPENVLKTRKALSESSGRFLVQNDAQLRSSAELAAKLYLYRHPSDNVGYLDFSDEMDQDGLPVPVNSESTRGVTFERGATSVVMDERSTEHSDSFLGRLFSAPIKSVSGEIKVGALGEEGKVNLESLFDVDNLPSFPAQVHVLNNMIAVLGGGFVVGFVAKQYPQVLSYLSDLNKLFSEISSYQSFADCVVTQLNVANAFDVVGAKDFTFSDVATLKKRRETILDREGRLLADPFEVVGVEGGGKVTKVTPAKENLSNPSIVRALNDEILVGVKLKSVKINSSSQAGASVKKLLYKDVETYFKLKGLDAAKFSSFAEQIESLSLYYSECPQSTDIPVSFCALVGNVFRSVIEDLLKEYRLTIDTVSDGITPTFLDFVVEFAKNPAASVVSSPSMPPELTSDMGPVVDLKSAAQGWSLKPGRLWNLAKKTGETRVVGLGDVKFNELEEAVVVAALLIVKSGKEGSSRDYFHNNQGELVSEFDFDKFCSDNRIGPLAKTSIVSAIREYLQGVDVY